MQQEENQKAEERASDVEVDPVKLEQLISEMKADQNFAFGILAGSATSLVGAAVWAVITVATGYQIGFMAVGVGFIVGYAVRAAGKGMSSIYGVVGAALALIGCLAGNLFSVCGILARQHRVSIFEILGQLNLRKDTLVTPIFNC